MYRPQNFDQLTEFVGATLDAIERLSDREWQRQRERDDLTRVAYLLDAVPSLRAAHLERFQRLAVGPVGEAKELGAHVYFGRLFDRDRYFVLKPADAAA